MRKSLRKGAYLALVSLATLMLASTSFSQGKGHGGGVGGGRGTGGGMGNGGGPPSGVGVDRGRDNASEKSGGRSDNGLENASMNSNGRSDAGLERARRAHENMRNADRELDDHPGVPRTLHISANSLRNGYQTALTTNPNLTFGNYVAATRVAQNLGPRFPNITRDRILDGLASGRSFGRTLHDLGLTDRDAKDVEKQAREEIKQAKKMK
jgi:hypothetical protein